MSFRPSKVFSCVALAAALASSASAQIVRTAAGSLEDVTAVRDLFRQDLGGGNTAGSNGSFGGVRREINWDGTPDARSLPNLLPLDFFNVNSPRGVTFWTAPGVAVSAKAGNPTGTAVRFGNFDPAYAERFAAFSEERLFAPVGSPVYDIHFLVPGTNETAVVTGFGAVFVDVDLDEVSWLEYFDAEGESLGRFDVPAAVGDRTFSFLGVLFPGAPSVARVRVATGDVALDEGGEPAGRDAVALDDFLYSEPVVAPGAPCTPTPTALCLLERRFRVEATFTANGNGGTAQAQPLSDDAGTFSFFEPDNREVLFKALDGCGINDRFWVYGAAATDVGFTITVTDTATGNQKEYSKEPGPPAPAITDSDAFATCDAP